MSPGDDAERRAQAVAAAAAGAPSYGMSAAVFRDCVETLEERVERYERARHVIEVERDIPVRIPCTECGGDGVLSCPSCGGTLRSACPECDGTGRVQGVRSTKKCPSCRGEGDRQCVRCGKQGRVVCPECDGRKSVPAGTRVERAGRTVVVIYPRDSAQARRHRGVDDPADFDRDPTGWPARLEHAEEVAAEDIPAELLPELGPRERIVRSEIQSFARSTFRVTYRVAGRRGHVIVEERPWRAVQGDESPLRLRRTLGWVGVAVAVLAMIFALTVFYGRHPWYGMYATRWPLWLAGLLQLLTVPLAIRAVALPRQAWTVGRTTLPVASAGVLGVVMAMAFVAPRPSVAVAEAAFAAGDLERAEHEARALGDLAVDPLSADRLLDAVYLERFRRAPDTGNAVALMRQPWRTRRARDVALRALRSRISGDLTGYERGRHQPGLVWISEHAREVAPDLASHAGRRAAVLGARLCAERTDYACAEWYLSEAVRVQAPSGEVEGARAFVAASLQTAITENLQSAGGQSPRSALVNLETALGHAERYERVVGREPTPSRPEIAERAASVGRVVEQLDRQVQREQERRDAAEQRRAERAQRATARTEARSARGESRGRSNRAYAPLLCRDGSLSPSCVCGGPRRGCCSWHGGVAGCSE